MHVWMPSVQPDHRRMASLASRVLTKAACAFSTARRSAVVVHRVPDAGRMRVRMFSAAPQEPSLVTRLKNDMKEAMKAKDQARLDAVRFINAAIKSREIELRESKAPLTDEEIIRVLQKSAKQRKDSIESYKAGGRQDLVEKEEKELLIVESYMPTMMGEAEVKAAVEAVVSELGATTQKDMGKVMVALKAKTGGRADNKMVSDLVKARLSSGK